MATSAIQGFNGNDGGANSRICGAAIIQGFGDEERLRDLAAIRRSRAATVMRSFRDVTMTVGRDSGKAVATRMGRLVSIAGVSGIGRRILSIIYIVELS